MREPRLPVTLLKGRATEVLYKGLPRLDDCNTMSVLELDAGSL